MKSPINRARVFKRFAFGTTLIAIAASAPAQDGPIKILADFSVGGSTDAQ